MFVRVCMFCLWSLVFFACRKDRTCQCTETERVQATSFDSLTVHTWTTDFQDVTRAFVREKMACYSSKTVKILPNQFVGYDPVTSQPVYEDITRTNERTCEIR